MTTSKAAKIGYAGTSMGSRMASIFLSMEDRFRVATLFDGVSTLAPEVTPRLKVKGQSVPLGHVDRPLDLKAGTWTRRDDGIVVCFDLPRGTSELALAAG